MIALIRIAVVVYFVLYSAFTLIGMLIAGLNGVFDKPEERK